ncbi:response regulator transcription factor [Pedobacter sp. SYP-B3415]|uniref:response regulator transcription factor n=1 Tax=Pedobacter sp. SYP-B3415 TaxID=2496641 RepID=UPI00101CA07E|nr:helix-turn-helix transcriptional regulator [Pedobacter sp. SYP-B3415]
MQDITTILETQFLEQASGRRDSEPDRFARAKNMARQYAAVEHAVVVLSDLIANTSYVCYGAAAAALGLSDTTHDVQLDSIWEEKIFARIHPDDLQAKHMQELQFFHFLKGIPAPERCHYHVIRKLRMRDASETYTNVLHRMYYLYDAETQHTAFALCLYGFGYFPSGGIEGRIVNARTGQFVDLADEQTNILSVREREILGMIHHGKQSKEIAAVLSISMNTVNRHRQNILEKLRVNNSVEACRIASSFNWIR